MSTDFNAGPVPDDILAAVSGYLRDTMGGFLQSSSGYVQAYVDYAPSTNPDGSVVSLPYAIVSEGDETYSAQSEDYNTGYLLTNIADGMVFISFLATTKAQARKNCRVAVRRMSDTKVSLAAQDGMVLTLLPVRSQRVPHEETGPDGSPTVYERVLIVQYKQQFAE